MNAQPNLAPAEVEDQVSPTSKWKAAMAHTSPVVDVMFWVVLAAIVAVSILIGSLLPT